MSLEAWGDEGDVGLDGYVTDDRCQELSREAFIRGAQMCREMMARFVEQGGDATAAISIRANWNPTWGDDPGKPTDKEYDEAKGRYDCWEWS